MRGMLGLLGLYKGTLGFCGLTKCISGPGKLEMHFWRLPKCISEVWGPLSSRYGPLKLSLPLQPLLWSSKSLLRLPLCLSADMQSMPHAVPQPGQDYGSWCGIAAHQVQKKGRQMHFGKVPKCISDV